MKLSTWIRRRSRFLIAAIATLGAVTTSYLTVAKLAGEATVCPVNGCDRVLSSSYASIFGLPLALFGVFAYTSVVVMAVAPWLIQPKTNKELRSLLEDWTWQPMFIVTTAMMIFSGYLMYLMTSEIKSLCLYCIASAIFSLSLFVLTLIGHAWEDIRQLFFTATVVAIITLIGTLAIYATPSPSYAEAGYPITTTSSASEIALARQLKQVGAKMYGVYWCSHCHDQKQLFGQQAFSQVNYIECDPKGKNARPDLCQASRIQGFPTWEIKDKFYQGEQSLEKLAELSRL